MEATYAKSSQVAAVLEATPNATNVTAYQPRVKSAYRQHLNYFAPLVGRKLYNNIRQNLIIFALTGTLRGSIDRITQPEICAENHLDRIILITEAYK